MIKKLSSLFSKVEPMATPINKTKVTKTKKPAPKQAMATKVPATKASATKMATPMNASSKLKVEKMNKSSASSRNDLLSKSMDIIAKRAFEIWQEEGCPNGRQDANWLQAEREIKAKLAV